MKWGLLKSIWDAFLSFLLRAICTAVLVAGLNGFFWALDIWWSDLDRLDDGRIGLVFFGSAVAIGAIGAFRRGKFEEDFSTIALAGMVAGGLAGHVHFGVGHARGRGLRRSPTFESVSLGSLLIGAWLLTWATVGELWYLRYGAIVGAIQIAWGLSLRRCRTKSRREPVEQFGQVVVDTGDRSNRNNAAACAETPRDNQFTDKVGPG